MFCIVVLLPSECFLVFLDSVCANCERLHLELSTLPHGELSNDLDVFVINFELFWLIQQRFLHSMDSEVGFEI